MEVAIRTVPAAYGSQCSLLSKVMYVVSKTTGPKLSQLLDECLVSYLLVLILNLASLCCQTVPGPALLLPGAKISDI